MFSGRLLERGWCVFFYKGNPMIHIPITSRQSDNIIVVGNSKGHHLAVSRWRPKEGDWFFLNFVKDGTSYENYFAREDIAIKDTIKFYYKVK